MPRAALRLALSLAIAVGGCARPPRERVAVGVPRLPAAGLFYIAQQNGYFAARGVDVEERRFTVGRDALAALMRGEVDAAIAYETPVVQAAPRAPDLEVLTTVHLSSRNTRVVARADRGVRREEDLRGKRIGVSRGTSAEFFLQVLLTSAGLRSDEVRIVDLPVEAAAGAVVRGELDAAVAWAPHADAALRTLGRNGTELATDVYLEVSTLLTRTALRQERGAALVRVIEALADAERLAEARPEEAFAALRLAFPDVDVEDLRTQWGRIEPSLGVSNVLATALEREDEWMRAGAKVDVRPLDLGRLLRPELLARVEPEAVTWIAGRRP